MATTASWQRVEDLAAAVRQRTSLVPRFAVLLGTGLGALAERLEDAVRIPYGELPGMPVSTAEGHAGELLLGFLGGAPALAFSGRLHCYEGYDVGEVVVPVRLARCLGAGALVMGSAVGGLDPRHAVGDLVVVDDHLNLMGVNPLVGPNDDGYGPRWPDMCAPYDPVLIAAAETAALARGHLLRRATYAAVLGPNLETRAEYRMLRTIGADVVGMSTVPETIAAVHCGLRVLALAVVTDRCLADALEPADVTSIIAAAQGAEPALTDLVLDLVPALGSAE